MVEYYRVLNGPTHAATRGELFLVNDPDRAMVEVSPLNQSTLLARRCREQAQEQTQEHETYQTRSCQTTHNFSQ
eukprot:13550013-Heterocapsa_arctica.AAC.1